MLNFFQNFGIWEQDVRGLIKSFNDGGCLADPSGLETYIYNEAIPLFFSLHTANIGPDKEGLYPMVTSERMQNMKQYAFQTIYTNFFPFFKKDKYDAAKKIFLAFAAKTINKDTLFFQAQAELASLINRKRNDRSFKEDIIQFSVDTYYEKIRFLRAEAKKVFNLDQFELSHRYIQLAKDLKIHLKLIIRYSEYLSAPGRPRHFLPPVKLQEESFAREIVNTIINDTLIKVALRKRP